ncbi:MAG: ABC transporter substrate-binding protein [Parvibaculaceae bacterium]|nr:ABC transporter substrate-binding protein [Parvibaculaceae bacterium]
MPNLSITSFNGTFKSLTKATRSIALIAGLAISAFFTTSAPAIADDVKNAEAFVDNLASSAITILASDSTPEVREDEFRTLFVANLDMRRIGLFTLGQYARTPTPAQKTEYLELVKEFIVKIYSGRLNEFSNETVKVLRATPKGKKGKQFLVRSQINFTTGREPVSVVWWLLKDGDTFKVFDVQVVGIWMAQEQRAAFASVISKNNGDFNALLTDLKRQIGEASADKQTAAN